MSSHTHDRRLAVIMATDAVGFSRLVRVDEDIALDALRAGHDMLAAEVTKQGGRIFSKAGDSAFAEFVSPDAAVKAAMAFQMAVFAYNRQISRDRQMRFRIGINLGTAVVEGDNLLGDCVNVAARLEGLSEPDGMCISGTVYDQVHERIQAKYDSLGGRRLKNIDTPVRAYRVRPSQKGRSIYAWGEETVQALRRRAWRTKREAVESVEKWGEEQGSKLRQRVEDIIEGPEPEPSEPTGAPSDGGPRGRPVSDGLSLPSGASVAVLPFAAEEDEPGLTYCTGLITEALIGALVRTPGLFVIARNSSFEAGRRGGELSRVGRQLGVRHLVVGQMRVTGGRLHTAVQLVDRTVGTADWEGTVVGDLGNLQHVVAQIWRGVAERLGTVTADVEAAALRPPMILDAYPYAQRARGLEKDTDEVTCAEAQALLEKAVRRDPAHAEGHARLSRAILRKAQVGTGPFEQELGESLEVAAKAVELDPLLPAAHAAEANAAMWLRMHERADQACEKAVALAPHDADVLETSASLSIWSGRPGQSLDEIKQAMRLDLLNPDKFLFDLGHARFCMGHYEDAISAFLRSAIRDPSFVPNQVFLASSYGHLREVGDAESVLKRCPEDSVRRLLDLLPYARLEDADRLRDGLYKGGLVL